MKLLFLRGQVVRDRPISEIIHNKLEDQDCVWIHLAYNLLEKNDYGEVWYWGGNRKHKYTENFVEKFIPSFKTYTPEFQPDVIFCRGGFPEYHHVLNRFPKSFKIYYGAGRRFLPQPGFSNYDLILQDSPQQLEISKRKFPNSKSVLFIKPASDNLFYPQEVKKDFDICFPANGTQEDIKGHSFVFQTVPKHFKVLNLGNNGKISPPSNVTRKRVLRTEMSRQIQRCKVGIVCCNGDVDSCPRVIPEMLASNIPIVVFNETRFWQEKYITPETGIISNKKNFWKDVEYVINNLDKFNPRKYYDNNLNLKIASKYIRDLLKI